jgi:lysylphosphatidylglycerol synthetase-like protein (DUF2156 family)
MAHDDSASPSDTPDERPRPQYGEYAPPGWSWQPPEHVDGSVPAAAEKPSADAAAAGTSASREAPTAGPAQPARPGLAAPARTRTWDRPVTLTLLILGILGVMFTIAMLQQLPAAMEMLHAQEGLPAYEPDPSVEATVAIGSVVQALLWILTAGVSVVLTVKGRTAFWIPLVGAAVSFITFFVVISIVVATDPVLLEHIGTGGL